MNSILKKYKEYLEVHKYKLTYYNYLKVIFKYLDEQKMTYKDLNNKIFTDFLRSRGVLATETLNLYIRTLKHFYKKFLEEKEAWIYEQKESKSERKIPNIITEKEMEKVLSYIISEDEVKHMTPLKIKAIVYTLFYTGIRKGEFLQLKRNDFDFVTKRLLIRIPNKGKKERIIILIDKLVNILQEYFNNENSKKTAFDVSAFQIDNMIKKFNKYLPNKHLTPHKMRHSYGRNLYTKGVDLNTIKEQMGHSDISTTIIYTNPDIDVQEKIIRDKLNG